MALFTTPRKTQFAESDAAGRIHFSQIPVYVEEAEHLFLEQEGYPIDLSSPSALRWPRVHFEATYHEGICPFSLLHILLTPAKVGTTSITWAWEVRNADQSHLVSNGEMKTVCCRVKDQKLFPTDLPPALKKRLLSGMA